LQLTHHCPYASNGGHADHAIGKAHNILEHNWSGNLGKPAQEGTHECKGDQILPQGQWIKSDCRTSKNCLLAGDASWDPTPVAAATF